MNALIFMILIAVIILIVKSQNKKKKENTVKDVVTDDVYFTKSKATSLKLPGYNMGLEYLDLVKNKREEHLFYGNTERVPIDKRNEVVKFYEQSKKDGWLYITEGNESVVNSFTKKDFTKIIEENNLPISGNKADLVERIVENLGFEKLYKLGEINNYIKLTDLGKAKIKEYRTDFNEQYTLFKQEVQKLFDLNQIEDACYNVTRYKESYPFNDTGFGISFSGKDLYDICILIKKSDVFKRIGLPKEHHNAMSNVMCMYFSFADFNYKEKLEEIYSEFEELLIKSDVVKNKDLPFADFANYIRGYEVAKYSEDQIVITPNNCVEYLYIYVADFTFTINLK